MQQLAIGDSAALQNATHAAVQFKAVLCAGGQSSASTWVYNVVAEILRERPSAEAPAFSRSYASQRVEGENVRQFYADSPEIFPGFDIFLDSLVIQTQRPSGSLREFVVRHHVPVVMSIREPRDAVASLMRRFGFSFESAFNAIAMGNECVLRLFHSVEPYVLRYEDRFFDREETVANLAAFVGVALTPRSVRNIFRSLTREEVAKKIERFRKSGIYGSQSRPVQYDPQSRWQLGHIGEITIGQYAEVLSPKEEKLVVAATARYCRAFGYTAEHMGH